MFPKTRHATGLSVPYQSLPLAQCRFLVRRRLDAHQCKAHLLRTNPINKLEITAEVAYQAIAVIEGNRLNRQTAISQQLGGPSHPHLKQVSPKCHPHFYPEQAEDTGISESQQPTDLLRSYRKRASPFFYESQDKLNACVHPSPRGCHSDS
jgi:hypothetical protein